MGYAQDYYTLRSIFFDGVAPPAIHMHLRMFDVRKDVPIGDLSSTKSTPGEKGGSVEVEIPPAEKDIFDSWLRKLWQEKDDSIDSFHNAGSLTFAKRSDTTAVQIPLQLRRNWEILDAFCFFWPATLAYSIKRVRNEV